MKTNVNVDQIKKIGTRMVSILGLSGSPVGVRLLPAAEGYPDNAEMLKEHRYCQALMKARRGQNVLLNKEGISCPAAAAAFGFRPLPSGLQSGKGLVGFGIVSDEAVGKKMFAEMPKLKPGKIDLLHLFSLDRAEYMPDIVVVEDEVEKLMWIALSYLHTKGGERVQSSTAVLQATCVDSTIIPYLEKCMNLGYGCYGCREATDIRMSEAVLGFPCFMLPAMIVHMEFLNKKAIPNSRSKQPLARLEKKDLNEQR